MTTEITKQQIFDVWTANAKSERFDAILAFVKDKFHYLEFSEDAVKELKKLLRTLCSKIDKKWAETGRYREYFLKKNVTWLKGYINLPDSVLQDVQPSFSNSPQRPRKSSEKVKNIHGIKCHMTESINCRLCLKTCKRVKPLNELKNGVPYWLMINSITDINLSGGDLDEKACVSCCRRLADAYDFKLLIESSDTSLRNSNNTKRITFNNIEDIKIKVEVPDDRTTQESLINNMQNDEQFHYHDTLIKRVAEVEHKPISVVEFLHSIKEVSEDEGCPVDDNMFGDDDYQPDDETQDADDSNEEWFDIPLNQRKTRNNVYDEIKPRATRSKKKLKDEDFDEDYIPPSLRNYFTLRKKSTKNQSKRSIGRPSHGKILPVPIKPQVLDNIRLSYIKEPKIKPPKVKEICHHCGKLCEKKYLGKHLLTHSTAEPQFKCDKCPKAYRDMHSLRTHKRRHEPRSIKCEHCVATFILKSDYLSHLRHHIGEKNFICELCSKAFKSKYQLKKHMIHMHNIGVKEYKCDLCDRVCKSKGLLKHHYRVHTGERPYNCEICSQPYSYKHDFNRHCLKKHGVLFKSRSVYVMNEEVLVKERALMRDLMLRMNGVDKDDLPENPFEGPQGHFAYQQMMKFLKTQQLPVDFQL